MFEWLLVALLADNSQSFLENVSLGGHSDRGAIIERFNPDFVAFKSQKSKMAY